MPNSIHLHFNESIRQTVSLYNSTKVINTLLYCSKYGEFKICWCIWKEVSRFKYFFLHISRFLFSDFTFLFICFTLKYFFFPDKCEFMAARIHWKSQIMSRSHLLEGGNTIKMPSMYQTYLKLWHDSFDIAHRWSKTNYSNIQRNFPNENGWRTKNIYT